MSITTRQLLDLRPGAKIRATLKSGREIRAQVTDRPTLACTGKPGIHRVRIDVVDVEDIPGDRVMFLSQHSSRHTVHGDRVVEVLA